MSGINPYIEQPSARRPERPFKVRFEPMGVEVEVDPEFLPEDHDGLPGSLLQIAQDAGVEIDHACGGVCACSTCHVVVREGADSVPEALEAEEDMLDNAPGLTLTSRLACQAVPDGSRDLVVEIPGWNRNLVKEGHGDG
jgi:2Fe-2S ferredoxin